MNKCIKIIYKSMRNKEIIKRNVLKLLYGAQLLSFEQIYTLRQLMGSVCFSVQKMRFAERGFALKREWKTLKNRIIAGEPCFRRQETATKIT